MVLNKTPGAGNNRPGKVRATRGIRNNNPGNIRYHAGNEWRGQVGNDGSFSIFDTPSSGIRALAKTIFNYEKFYNLATVEGIISRWAPSIENNTTSYVSSVASRLGVEPDQLLNLGQVMPELVKAIIYHENGSQPYTDQTIRQGVRAV